MDPDIPQELIDAGLGYDQLFVPAVFKQWTTPVLTAANVTRGAHVLDVACGSGVLARAALDRVGNRGRVVGIDPAPGMLAAARKIQPDIEWLESTAEALPLGDALFDSVVSQFGIMFFADRLRAATEMLRTLKTGGHVAIAFWNSVADNPAYRDFAELLDRAIGAPAAEALRLPYTLGNPQMVTDVLEAAGFCNVRLATQSGTANFPSLRAMVEADLRGWLPLFDICLSEAEIEGLLVDADKVLGGYVERSGAAVFPISAHIVAAQKS